MLVFSYVVKGIKIKITAKFRASIRLRFEDTKRIMSPEMRPKSCGTFEKRAPDTLDALNFIARMFHFLHIMTGTNPELLSGLLVDVNVTANISTQWSFDPS